MIAIAHVINNRANAGLHENSHYMNVIGGDFKCMTDPESHQLTRYPEQFDTITEKLFANLENCFDGFLVDPTGGALYYEQMHEGGKLPKGKTLVATIGNTLFYI
jgi:hypothetical protein